MFSQTDPDLDTLDALDSGVDKVSPTFLPAVSPDHLSILFWVPERVPK